MSTEAPRAGLRAWLELWRVSNVPTVVSNALTGCAIGAIGVSDFPWRAFGLSATALTLIYIAGMALNDALDAETDRRERPLRPIPSGRISRAGAFGFAVGANAAALALLLLAGRQALGAGSVLVACAVLYNVLHRRAGASVLLMGACRAFAVITAAAAVAWPPDWGWLGIAAGALWVYVVAISVVARAEAGHGNRIRAVVAMICAISLLDALALGLLSRWPQALGALGCFMLSLLAQRRVIGT